MGYNQDDRDRDDLVAVSIIELLRLAEGDDTPVRADDPDETPVPDDPPPSNVLRFELDNYIVQEKIPRLIYHVAIPRGTYKVLRYGYTLSDFVFPAKTKSVIGGFAFHGSADFFLGQQVIKEDGQVLIVHAAGIPKDGRKTPLPKGLRFGKEPITVVHTCDLNTKEVWSRFTDEHGKEGKSCFSVPAKLDSFEVGGKGMQFRLHQHTNHEKADGVAQERPAIGSRYTNVWLEVS